MGVIVNQQVWFLDELSGPFGIPGKQMQLNLKGRQVVSRIEIRQVFLGKETGNIIGIKPGLDDIGFDGIVEFLKKNNFIRLFHDQNACKVI